MKKLLTLVLALVALAVFSGLGVAQQKGVEKSPPTGGEMKQPATGERGVKLDRFQPLGRMTGKVLQVDGKAKTFTVMSKGQAVTFTAESWNEVQAKIKVGEIIDITYTQTPGGPMEATTINTSKSNTY